MIHFHGLPLTPINQLYTMAGKHFCVTPVHCSKNQVRIAFEIGQSVLLDNGAFSSYKNGKPVDPVVLYEWLEDKLAHPHKAIILDEIGGSVEQQKEKIADWPFAENLSIPVWHLDKPFGYLLDLTQKFTHVAFGSAGEYWEIGSDLWIHRIDGAFNEIAKRHGTLPWIHGLRMMAQAGKRWPFASVDSANVARNYKDTMTCPGLMASKIDRVQSPIGWHRQALQQQLFQANDRVSQLESDNDSLRERWEQCQ